MQSESPTDADDIDRKSLRALRERFLGLNRDRLEALRARLSEEQRGFVDAAPLLVHSNHAALPGFVDFDTPSGIDRYVPDRRATNAVRKMALSFVLERFVERRSQLQAVCVTALPGDVLELTVCSAFATHTALNEKLVRIVRYAADRGVALQATLLDPAEEQAGRSRLRTPHLSRDAFYRSAILLAGRYPVWWLVPPQLDHTYAAYCTRLTAQRFIGRDEVFDLGRAQSIPRGECLAAGVDLLEAALLAPYLHIPALMLLEHYANDASARPLAHLYKERIWRGETSVDASTLMEESVAAYLTARDDLERLQLARDCRRGLPRDPTIAELQRENLRVNAELQRAHLELTRLASENKSSDAVARLAVVADRIAQLVEHRDGPIPPLNPALWPKRVSGTVRLETRDGEWRLRDEDTTAFAAPRLAGVLAWAHLHRLGIDNLRVAGAHSASCTRTLELLARYAGGKALEPSTLLIVNAQESPHFAQAAPGDAIVSDWDDPLDFSGFHTCLVAGIDVLQVSAAGIASNGYAGADGLIAVLVGLLSEPPTVLRVCCVGERGRAIEERIGTLAARLSDSFRLDERARFVFALADGYVVIERTDERFRARRYTDDAQLFEALALPGRGRGLRVDLRSARLGALQKLCDISSTERDALLVHERRGHVAVLLAARDGSMHRFDTPPRPAREIADDLLALLAPQRHSGLRSPEIFVVTSSDAPQRVVASAARHHASDTTTAGARRNLVAMLREKFAADKEPARRPSVA